MSDKALLLLHKMADEFKKSNRTSFDSMFYMNYPDSVVDELEDNGYIVRKNDIIASIVLTTAGYEKATS